MSSSGCDSNPPRSQEGSSSSTTSKTSPAQIDAGRATNFSRIAAVSLTHASCGFCRAFLLMSLSAQPSALLARARPRSQADLRAGHRAHAQGASSSAADGRYYIRGNLASACFCLAPSSSRSPSWTIAFVAPPCAPIGMARHLGLSDMPRRLGHHGGRHRRCRSRPKARPSAFADAYADRGQRRIAGAELLAGVAASASLCCSPRCTVDACRQTRLLRSASRSPPPAMRSRWIP